MLRSFRRDHFIKSKALGQVMSFCYKSILADRTIFRNSYDKGRVISIYQLEHKTNERMSQSINQGYTLITHRVSASINGNHHSPHPKQFIFFRWNRYITLYILFRYLLYHKPVFQIQQNWKICYDIIIYFQHSQRINKSIQALLYRTISLNTLHMTVRLWVTNGHHWSGNSFIWNRCLHEFLLSFNALQSCDPLIGYARFRNAFPPSSFLDVNQLLSWEST